VWHETKLQHFITEKLLTVLQETGSNIKVGVKSTFFFNISLNGDNFYTHKHNQEN